MKKIVLSIISLLGVIFLLVACKGKKEFSIGIVQIVDHPSLNTIRDSIVEKLNELGYTKENTNFYLDSAGADTTLASHICAGYVDKNVNAIVAIATPTAMAAVNACKNTNIPVIFSAVSDPVGAGIVDSISNPGNKCTGTCDQLQVDKILDIAKTIDPELKKLGVLFNNSEENSVSNIRAAKAWAQINNVTIIEKTGSNANELTIAAEELKSQCDAVFAPNDNTVATDGTMTALSKKFMEAKIPFYVGADSMVQQGGFATNGIEYVDLGHETGIMVDQVIKGKKVSDIPVKIFDTDLSIYVNESYLQALNITLPETIQSNPKLKLI